MNGGAQAKNVPFIFARRPEFAGCGGEPEVTVCHSRRAGFTLKLGGLGQLSHEVTDMNANTVEYTWRSKDLFTPEDELVLKIPSFPAMIAGWLGRDQFIIHVVPDGAELHSGPERMVVWSAGSRWYIFQWLPRTDVPVWSPPAREGWLLRYLAANSLDLFGSVPCV